MVVATLTLLCACSSADPDEVVAESPSTSGAPTSGAPSSRPPFQTAPTGPVRTSPEPSTSIQQPPADLLRAIEDDLRRRGLDPVGLVVVESAPVRWPNGALGCPEPGRMYTQAIEQGWRVIVQLDGRSHDYRSGNSGRPVLCTRGGGAVPSNPHS